MADKKISALTAASTPLAGTEVLPIVQSGATVKVAVSDLTAGRAMAALSLTTNTYKAASSSGGALQNSSGTPQLQWGAGGGNNLSVDVAININPANAAVAISPTGTGTVAISPAGALTINPTTASTINNTSIGATTASTGGFTTVTASGKLLAGTSSSPSQQAVIYRTDSSTANGSLLLDGNGNYAGVQFAQSGNLRGSLSTDAAGLYMTHESNIYFYTGAAGNVSGTNRLQINSSGDLILAGSTAQKATGTTWSNPSDQRIKDNIRDYTKGTAELMQVRVREWEYNGKGDTIEGTKGLGVVADEVMVVLPDTVETYEAKLNADDEEVTAIKKFDATEITWLLVKTVQEQQALITTLADRITVLEAQ